MELNEFEKEVLLNLEYFTALKASDTNEKLEWTRSWKRDIDRSAYELTGQAMNWYRPIELFDRLDEVEGSAGFECVLLMAVLYKPLYTADDQLPYNAAESDKFIRELLSPYISEETIESWKECFRAELSAQLKKPMKRTFMQVLLRSWDGHKNAVWHTSLYEAGNRRKKVNACLAALAVTEIKEIFIGEFHDVRYCRMLKAKAETMDAQLAQTIERAIEEAVVPGGHPGD